MSAAQTIGNFKGQSLRVDPAILAGVKERMDKLEDQPEEQEGANQPSFRGKSAKRCFLAQAPSCTRPELTGEALADQTQMSPAQLAKLMVNSPSSFAKVPDGIQKLALSLVTNGKDQNSGNLFDYLTALILFQIATGKSQTELAGLNQSISDASVTLMKAASVQAAADLKKFEDQQEAFKSTSFWSTLLSVAGVALGALVFFVTGSPILLVVAILGVITANVTTSNGESLDQDLSDALGSAALSISTEMCGGTPPAALVTAIKDVLFAAVAIAEAVLLGGVEEALESGSEIADSVVAAAEGGAEGGAEAAEQAGEEVSEDAGSVSQGGAEVAETVSNTTEEVADTAKTIAKSAFRRRLGKLLMVSSSSGPLLPQISQQIAKAAFPNDPTAQAIFAASIQLGVGLAGSLGGSALNGAFRGPGLVALLTSQVGEQVYQRGTVVLKCLQTVTNVSAAGCEFATGKTLLDEADTLNDQAATRLTMALTQGVMDSLQTSAMSDKSMFSGVYKEQAQMQDLSARLEPQDVRNYQG